VATESRPHSGDKDSASPDLLRSLWDFDKNRPRSVQLKVPAGAPEALGYGYQLEALKEIGGHTMGEYLQGAFQEFDKLNRDANTFWEWVNDQMQVDLQLVQI
jgi:hypothetical protein